MDNRQDVDTIEQAYQEQLKTLYANLWASAFGVDGDVHPISSESVLRFRAGVMMAREARDLASQVVSQK